MQKFRCIVSLLAIVLCATISTQAQFTRQQAIDTVINHVVAADTGTIKVYIADSIYTTTDTPVTYTGDTITSPYGSYHLFFVDDIPAANWQHPCRYLMVSSTTGSISTVNQTTFPAGLGQEYSLIADIPAHQAFDPGQQPDITPPPANPDGDLYAVLVAGNITYGDEKKYSNDMALMYNTLLENGYTKENIIVHYGDGIGTHEDYGDDFDGPPESDDIDYPAYRTDIEATFTMLSNTLDDNDVLFVYVTDHGGNKIINGSWTEYIALSHPSLNVDYLYDSEFTILLDGITCSEVIFVMQQCYSGGFIDDVMHNTTLDAADVQIYTAAGTGNNFSNGLSYSEQWLTNNLYDEFTFYWCAAVRGYYPDFEYPWTTEIVTGQFPFENVPDLGDHHDGDHDPDLNADGYISMEEAFEYALYMDTWVDDGVYYPHAQVNPENPMDDDGDCAECQTLTGYAGHITLEALNGHQKTFRVSGTFTIDNYLEFANNTQTGVYLAENAEILVANLITDDNVTFTGTSANNQIRVSNSMQLGNNNTFTSDEVLWDVFLDGDQMQTTINQATFENCRLHNYGEALTITNSTFDDCQYTFSHKGAVSITETDFNRTWLYLENTEDNDNKVTVYDCNFNTDVFMVGIDLWNYGKFDISHNSIDGFYNGIQLMQSGYGPARNQNIHHNTITNCTQNGIVAYGSIATIHTNQINGNRYGVWFGNNSDIILHGYSSAGSYQQTQVIRDNSKYEVYASQYSFPIYFRYNAIIDDDNIGGASDALVYHNAGSGVSKDVRYNCWEETAGSFSASQDLYPGGCIWSPTWCPGGSSDRTPGADEDMYEVAVNLFDSEDYAGAKTIYQTLIGQYPESKFAKAAMQELFALEQYGSDDYNSLKQYYTSNSTIQSDTTLNETGKYLAAKCDIKTANWPDAIGFYENSILNPESFEDSIFAIIDLGYAYFMMENSGQKSAYSGNLYQHKPESKEQFKENRDYLLSLLPAEFKHNVESVPADAMQSNITLFQNTPNPATESTVLSFELNEDAKIIISLHDYTGSKIMEPYNKFTQSGTRSVAIDLRTLSPGVYFYSIFSNGQKVYTQKLIKM